MRITIKTKEKRKLTYYSKIWVWRSHIWVFKCAFWENDRWQNSHRNFFSPLHSYLKCLTALVSYLYCLPQLLGHWKTLCSNRPVRMVLVIDLANHTLLTWISKTKIFILKIKFKKKQRKKLKKLEYSIWDTEVQFSVSYLSFNM